MSILIAPITIDGTPYCPNQGSGSWRTQTITTGDAGKPFLAPNPTDQVDLVDSGLIVPSDADDRWMLAENDQVGSTRIGEGTLKFGCICPSELELLFRSDSDNASANPYVEIYVNAALAETLELTGLNRQNSTANEKSLTIYLTPSPCGNIVEVRAYSSQALGNSYAYMEVTGVT